MIRMLALALTAVLLAPEIIAQPAQPLERHEWVIRDFQTESGVVLPEARLVYTTLGKLNAANDNAILLPSHYMANFNGYNWLIGAAPDRALDPARDFLILTELFGNGHPLISDPGPYKYDSSADRKYVVSTKAHNTVNIDGQNTGAELMIWGNHQGAPQPIGSKIANVWLSGASWDVWFGNVGWNVISYVRTSPTTWSNASTNPGSHKARSRNMPGRTASAPSKSQTVRSEAPRGSRS